MTAAVLLSCALFALAPAAVARYEPLGSGVTKLSLDRPFLALLKQNGVKLTAAAPAKVKGKTVTFPVSGDKFDPTTATGTVTHDGALIFSAGPRSVRLRSLTLKTTQRNAPLSAKVGGGQLKLATAAKLAVARAGFGNEVRVSALRLSAKFAGRLDKKLHLKGTFEAGQAIGSILTRASPATVAIDASGRAGFAPDPAILAKLDSLFVAVNPIFPAERVGAGFDLSISGGVIAPDASSGVLETTGSLELLQLGGGQVFWRDAWFDLGAGTAAVELEVQPAPPYAGKVGRVAVAALGLSGATITSNPKARTVSVLGASLTLGAEAALTFNEVFAERKDLFRAGDALGSLSFTAQGQ